MKAVPAVHKYRIPFLVLLFVSLGWFTVGGVIGYLWGSTQQQSRSWVPGERLEATGAGAVAPPVIEPAGPDPVAAPTPLPKPATPAQDSKPVTEPAVASTKSAPVPVISTSYKAVCTNTCPQARNGVCDEGRLPNGTPGNITTEVAIYLVLCDPGTDCADCGEWDGPPPSKTWSESLAPAAYLAEKKVKVQARLSATVPAVTMAFTDSTLDVDVSGAMQHTRGVEMGISRVFVDILQNKCGTGTAQFVDVGANFGWYTLLAAALNCKVIAWEPVPLFRAFLELSLQLSRLQHKVQIHTSVVANDASIVYEVVVPQRGIWGTAGIDGANVDKAVDNQGDYVRLKVPGERLDDQVTGEVAMMKVDVEGYEPSVLASAAILIAAKKIQNILLEYSPGVYERSHRWKDMHEMPGMLMHLVKSGFTILQIPDHVARRAFFMEPLGKLPHVTAGNLEYDLKDAERMANRTLGCGYPEALNAFPAFGGGCGALPEDLHPKSFHTEFGHNTNILASLQPIQALIGDPVGLVSLKKDANTWWTEKPYGSGGRMCDGLPPQYQTRHHCKCSDKAVCGKEEDTINKLLADNKLTHLG